MNIDMLRKQSASLTEKLQKQFKEQSSGGRNEDTRFWKPTTDKAGNAYAVIRFLPPPFDPDSPTGFEDSAYVKRLSYGFDGPGGWYIEQSPRTIDLDDPVTELNGAAYRSKIESEIEKAKKRKMRTKFVSNILVLEDPANPSAVGKVFLYEYGKQIFDMINDKLFPQFPDEPRMNAFDLWEGANFKLKVIKKDNFPNYSKSEFDRESSLYDGDKQKLESIMKVAYSLKAFLDPSNFKSYDELKRRMEKVLGIAGSGPVTRSDFKREEREDFGDDLRQVDEPVRRQPAPQVRKTETPEDDGDEMEFFKRIAEGR